MKAIVFEDFGKVGLAELPKPEIEDTQDVVVKVGTTAICGSDLHVLHGRIPGMDPGSVLGHEFTGVVESVGSGVRGFHEGDRVLASFNIPCGECWFCQRREFNLCTDQRVFGYGSFFGNLNGGQAEYVRVPNADICLHKIPTLMGDEEILFAGDIFTAGLEAATQARIEHGDAVAVIGCGPVGLMAIQAAKTFAPKVIFAVDTVEGRLAVAESFGATPVNASQSHPPSVIQDATDGRGADRVLECVGAPAAFLSALDMVRPGGVISVIGVYSEPELDFPINLSFVRAIDIKFCGTANIVGRWDKSIELIGSHEVNPQAIVSHHMKLGDGVEGYRLFENRTALKVVLAP